MSILVRAPATTANLGPGFDCLGLALDLWNEVEVSQQGSVLEFDIQGEGAGKLPQNKENAIFQAMKSYADRHGKSLPAGLRITCQNNIPLGSGLGSSSAAAVAGIMAAAKLLNLPQDTTDQLACASQLEGHPDNVAPCLLGGLVASMVDRDQIIARKIPVAPLNLVIVVPDFNLPTHQARAALPVNIPHKDAVFNLGHAVMLTEALRNSDLELLTAAMQDRLHQPYRFSLIPGATNAIAAAQNAGAAAVVLSGAGPSLLAILRDTSQSQNISTVMVKAFQQAGLSARVFTPKISSNGASVCTI